MGHMTTAPDWRPVLAPRGQYSALVRVGSSPARVAHGNGGRLAFVAAPYIEAVHDRRGWRPDLSVRLSLLTGREVMRLRMSGVTAVCPSLMLGAMCEASHLVPDAPAPSDRRGWEEWARPILFAAGQIVVPDIEGWHRCPLIWRQVQWALGRNVPVHVYAGGLPS